MSTGQEITGEARLEVQNIGGIDEATVTFSPGITVLEGRNATNRTSLLQAMMAVSGSNDVSIKGDAEGAEVQLTLDDEEYERSLSRRNNQIQTSGTPYLDDPTLANLFAFLLESNEARQAVARGDNLRELIMRPVDTDEIQHRVEQLVDERRNIDNKLEEIDSLKGRLPELEEKRTKLRDQLHSKAEELKAKEAEIKSIDADVEETREAKSAFEEKLGKLSDKRSDLEETRYALETEQERLNALEREQKELQAELEELKEAPMGELQELESEVSRLRERKRATEVEINEIQTVIGFNEEMLEEEDHELFAAVGKDDSSDEPVTDQLLKGDNVTCWTCGSEVGHEQIESTLERLRELSSQKFETKSELDDRLDELMNEQQELQEVQQSRERIKRRLTELDNEIENQERDIVDLEDRRETLRSEIGDIETEVDEFENDSRSEILELHKEANQLEYKIGRLEGDRERIEDEIESVEAEIDRQSALEEDRAELQETIEDLRTKIERLEQDAIEEFNEHMSIVLDLLNYQNLVRIWLERTETSVREGRQQVTKSIFELHVVRSTESGTTYEDSIDHLSESEREVTGLVFALAGYLVHDVHEIVPFMLLDSLEAIDSERIAALIDYFRDYSEFLVVALLPEDASKLNCEYNHITEI